MPRGTSIHNHVGVALNGLNAHLNVDGSVTPVLFDILAPPKSAFEVHSLRFTITDSNIRPDRFGGISPGLANGIVVTAAAGDVPIIESSFPITTNQGLIAMGSNAQFLDFGQAVNILTVDTQFAIVGFSPVLRGTDKIEIAVNDDLTSLVDFTVTAIGTEFLL